MKNRKWLSVVAGTTLMATLVVSPGLAFAKQGPPVTELTNNLSVPAIFVPDSGTFTVSCTGDTASALVAPIGDPSTGWEVPGYYYVQGENTWQAQCYSAAANTVTALGDFGDNLTSGALKSGTPIRVEVGLIENGGTGIAMNGYKVVKLQPSLSDNESAYGTLATPSGGGYVATPQIFPYTLDGVTYGVRVFDASATFSIYNETTHTYVVAENTPMSAEINASGAVVYGYNWGVGGHGVKSLPTAGTYVLAFHAPNVNLNGVSAGGGGATTKVENDHTVSITFVVNAKNNGGGRRNA